MMAQPNAVIKLDFYTGMPQLVTNRIISSGREVIIDYGNDYKFK